MLLLFTALFSCNSEPKKPEVFIPEDTIVIAPIPDTLTPDNADAFYIRTGKTTPEEIISFAKTLRGIPYEYACASPEQGFDCSGFVNYVFDHFDIAAPRSSSGFADVGKSVPLEVAKSGDIILFTGTNPAVREVGHIGIVLFHEGDSLRFIHSSSGSADGVTVSDLNNAYRERFMKIVRVFSTHE